MEQDMTGGIYDFMEGSNDEDYCIDCGAPLHETITMPDGSKRMVAHETGATQCQQNARENQIFMNGQFDIDMRESELAEEEGGDLY